MSMRNVLFLFLSSATLGIGCSSEHPNTQTPSESTPAGMSSEGSHEVNTSTSKSDKPTVIPVAYGTATPTAASAALCEAQQIVCPAGKDGDPGAVGAQGEKGDPGLPGKDGEQGSVGPMGPQGLTGATGSQGLPGKDGQDGAPGTPGARGPQGIQGVAGVAGPKGDPGKDGSFAVGSLYWVSAQTHNTQVGPVDISATATCAPGDVALSGRCDRASLPAGLDGAGLTVNGSDPTERPIAWSCQWLAVQANTYGTANVLCLSMP